MVYEKESFGTRRSGESVFEGSCETPNETQSDPDIIPLTGRHVLEVWKHFVRKRVGNEVKAECNYCKGLYAGGPNAGTSHLKEHTKKCRNKRSQDIRQSRLFGTQTNPFDNTETPTMAPYEFRQEDGRRDVAEMIILHEYPICMVEHFGFRKLCKTLQPGFKVPARNTTRKDIMKRYGIEKECLTELLLKTKGKIALTTDMWTSSNQRKGYMAVTVHFIDNNWKLQSRILRFMYVEAPHTKEVLVDALCKCIYDWNLDCRISSITLDNCTTNDGMMNILRLKLQNNSLILNEKFLHMRCCAHILNLIVQDGLNIIGEGIERVRSSVVFWTSSVLRKTNFEEAAKVNTPSCSKKLLLDCKTRWNSIYEMLEVAIMYRKVFDILSDRESHVYKCSPHIEDWEKAERICEKLEIFSDATQEFSATKHPTANIYFSNICEIKDHLNMWVKSSDYLIKDMATEMLLKYNKYWNEVNTVLAVVAVLDPRYKLPLIRYYYKRFYDEYDVEFEVNKVKDVLKDLVKEYSARYEKEKGKEPSAMSTSSCSTISGKRKLCDFAKYLEVEENQVEEKSELDNYLLTSNVPFGNSHDYDILIWWKTNGSTFPILQKIARNILSIPVSSVASESVFSTGGRVLSAHRSRLLPSTVEALICAQNWIWTDIKGGGEFKEVEYHQVVEELEEEHCITDDEST